MIDYEYKPHLEEDEPNYGNVSLSYPYLVKHDKKIHAGLFLFFLFATIFVVLKFTEVNNETPDIDIYVSSTVTYSSNYKMASMDIAAAKKNALFSYTEEDWEKTKTKVKQIQDSMALVKQQDREQFIKDSLMIELAKQDAENLKLAEEKKAKITYTAVIDDGITKRVVDVNTISDSLTPEIAMQVGKSFQTISVQTAKDRQAEIDKNSEYYKHERLKTESML